MYNAAENFTEFIELKNVGKFSYNLNFAKIYLNSKKILFRFPIGFSLLTGEFCVISEDPYLFKSNYGKKSLGKFNGKLPSSGEIQILDALNRTIFSVKYSNDNNWPRESNFFCDIIHLLFSRDFFSALFFLVVFCDFF